jgi:hypothetical protein
VIYRLNIIETDFRLGKTTLFEHFYRKFAVVKRAIQPCSENLPLSSVQSNRAVFFRIVRYLWSAVLVKAGFAVEI